MGYRLSYFVIVCCSIFFCCHAISVISIDKSCKVRNGCVFKSAEMTILDCSSVLLDKAPKLGPECPTPQAMVFRLKHLTKEAIANVHRLSTKSLTLYDSSLQTLPSDVFDKLWKLKVLNLRIKHLKTLPEKTFKQQDKLKRLDVSSGDLHCDCSLKWIKTSKIDMVATKCSSPAFLANKRLNNITLDELCDVDECSASTANPICGSNAVCENTLGSYKCICNRGFSGNGKTCSDRDECSENTHNCTGKHTKCINTVGSYKCGCKPGFLEKGSTCIDVDECSTKQHNCSIQASCNNFPGGFKCSCNFGYLGNGHFCLATTELSLVNRLMKKNRLFSFLQKRKLIPHVLIAAGILLLVIPMALCLCVCCCKRRRRRKKYKQYKEVPTNETTGEAKTSRKKKRFFRRRKDGPSGFKKPPTKRVAEEDLYVRPMDNYQHEPTPSPSGGSAPPPPPPPPPLRRKV